jgi:hypothetical protein
MSLPDAWLQRLDFFGTPLVIEPSPGQLSSDAGLLPFASRSPRRARQASLAGDRPGKPAHKFVFGVVGGVATQRILPIFPGAQPGGVRISDLRPEALPTEGAGTGPWHCGKVTRLARRNWKWHSGLVRWESLAKGGGVGNVTPRFWQCYSGAGGWLGA